MSAENEPKKPLISHDNKMYDLGKLAKPIDYLKDVEEFLRIGGKLPTEYPPVPGMIPEYILIFLFEELLETIVAHGYSYRRKRGLLRTLNDMLQTVKLPQEEGKEYNNPDVYKIADGLTDILYVLCNAIIMGGYTSVFDSVWKEVHNSNMSKFTQDYHEAVTTIPTLEGDCTVKDGYDSFGNLYYFVERSDGKIMKPKNYNRPDIRKVINAYIKEINK